MDDLESFFYVLVWISFGFTGPGQKLNPFPERLRRWENADPTEAMDAKSNAITYSFAETYLVKPYFGSVFGTLLRKLSRFFGAADMNRVESMGKPIPSLMKLKATSSQAYNTVLGYVDEAIAALESEPPETECKNIPDPAQTPTAGNFAVPDPPPSTKQRFAKRGSGSIEDDEPSGLYYKRRKHRYETRSSSSLSTSHDGTSDS